MGYIMILDLAVVEEAVKLFENDYYIKFLCDQETDFKSINFNII